jgi:hypothetical protein
MSNKTLPDTITSYDLLKMAAVLLMIIDHTGLYFFHGNEWFRLLGRFGMPVWFFLIGYARSRDIGPRLWGAVAFLAVFQAVTWRYLFPLDALATILIIRLTIDIAMKFAAPSFLILTAFCLVMQMVMWPTMLIFDYGAVAFFPAMLGWFIRRRQDSEIIWHPFVLPVFIGFVFLSFLVQQMMLFPFTAVQVFLLMTGMAGVFWTLLNFRLEFYSRLTSGLGKYGAGIVRFFGRRTLEIYVTQWVILTLLAMLLDPGHFAARQFSLLIH